MSGCVIRVIMPRPALRMLGFGAAMACACAAAAQRQASVEPAGRASWAQIVAANAAGAEGRAAPEVIRHPPIEEGSSTLEIGPSTAPLAPESLRAEAASAVGLVDLTLTDNFLAMADNNTSIPPDTMGAVGPDHLMTTLNTGIGVQTRDGAQVSIVDDDAFWIEGTGVGLNAFDPVLLFDSLSQRWIMTADANSRSTQSKALFAISDTDDPTGMWTFYIFDADPADLLWSDFPGLGVNGTWIAVTNNMFTVTGTNFSGVKMWVIDKSTALAGGELTVTIFDPGFDEAGGVSTRGTMRPSQTFDPDEPDLFLVENPRITSLGLPMLRLSRITGMGDSPQWAPLPGVIEGTGLYPVENDFNFGQVDASQAGTDVRVDTNNTRIINAVYRNGRLWCAHSGGLPASSVTDRTGAFWYEFDPRAGSPLIQSGVIAGVANTHCFFPSISVNSANDMSIGFSRSDPSRFVEAAFTGRLASDPPGLTRPVTVLKAGEDSYEKDFNTSRVRWGDYSATVVDPADDLTFWTIQQYAAEDVGPDKRDDRWGVWWGRIGTARGCPSDLLQNGVTDGADLGVLLGAWGSSGSPADLNGDGAVDGADLGMLLGAWGPCP